MLHSHGVYQFRHFNNDGLVFNENTHVCQIITIENEYEKFWHFFIDTLFFIYPKKLTRLLWRFKMSKSDIYLFGSSSEHLTQFFDIIICVLWCCFFHKPFITSPYCQTIKLAELFQGEKYPWIFFMLKEYHLNQEVFMKTEQFRKMYCINIMWLRIDNLKCIDYWLTITVEQNHQTMP